MAQVGIDEVGRGCWAGPLVAAAVRLMTEIPDLADSKVLSKSQRVHLAELIRQNAAVGIGWVTNTEVDTHGLTEAVRLAMRRAYKQIAQPDDIVIIDGNYNYLPELPDSSAVIKADGSVAEVSAASIVAKVARDTYMQNLDKAYAVWQFDKHVGYGTALHRDALAEHGVSDMHRKSYKPIKAFL